MTDTEKLPALPEKWCWTTLGEITEIIRGASPRPKGDPRYFGGDIPWIMISDISKEKGKYISKTKDTVTEEGATKSRYLKSGTLILSNSGTVCVPKILAVDGCIHDGFVAFPDLTINLDMFYLYYYFDHIRQRIIQENRQGITQVNLNTTIVKNINTPFPPLPEQHRIVQKIEELFTDLDAGIKELEKAKVQIKNYRQAVLKAAFEGEFTESLRELNLGTVEPASILVEKIVREQKTLGKKLESYKLNESNLPRIPTTWIWVAIGNIFEVKPGGTPSRKEPEYWNGTVPWVSSGEVANCIINETQEFITQKGVENSNAKTNAPGTVLLAMIGEGKTRGQVAILNIEATTNQNVAAVRCANTPILPKYVFFWLQSRYEKNRTRGSGGMQQALNARIIKEMPIPVPPIEEQKIIVSEIERRFSVIDQIEKTIDQSLAQAEKLRQSILKKAFEGKLVPQDPNDEPASVLLERIKEEKVRAESRKKPGKGRKVKAETKMEVSGKMKQMELF